MLQQGGEGEKNTLMASSQKALSRAAELVARAADVRKREAEATIDKVDLFSYKHVARRLESLLPQNVVSAELSAMKGEILASKIIGKASMTLAGIVDSFRKSIRPPLPNAGHKDGYDKSISLTLHLSDEVLQKVSSLIHQAEFGHAIAEVSSELIRFLTTGQWPDLLLPEDSVKLGTIFGHVLPELDTAVGAILKTLKEEGNLTVEQSNLGALRLCIQTTKQSLSANVDREDSLIAFSNWNPPGWVLLANVSFAKFSFLGCAAALSEAVDSHDGSEDCRFALNDLYNRIEQCSTQIVNVSLRLSTLDLTNEKLVNELTELGNVVNNHSQTLLDSVRELLTANGDADACRSLTKDSLGSLAKLSLVLRTENMGANESENLHSMSPESHDAWKAVTQMVQSIRAIDGDKEDINYLLRAQSIQHKFEDAVENEPKLARSLSTISTLEKVRIHYVTAMEFETFHLVVHSALFICLL